MNVARQEQDKQKKLNKIEFAKQIEKMRERDQELVTGIFNNKENPRGGVEFSFCIYPGDDNVVYRLVDGERYTIPRGVARHLNNNCYYKEYKHMQGEFGQTGIRVGQNTGLLQAKDQMQVSTKIHRYEFRSLEFMDDDLDMYPTGLAEVKMGPIGS